MFLALSFLPDPTGLQLPGRGGARMMTPQIDRRGARSFYMAGQLVLRDASAFESRRADRTRWVGARACAEVIQVDVTLWCDRRPCFPPVFF
jgi:hypothetical protein